jgi:SAM-dependent methyltransferase
MRILANWHMNRSTIQVEQICCPLCGSESYRSVTKVVDFTYGVPGSFHVVRCKGCSHIYLNPRPTLASILDCYPTEYAPYRNNQLAKRGNHNAEGELHTLSRGPTPGPDQPKTGSESAGLHRGWKRVPRAIMRWLWQENATLVPNPPREGSRMLEVGCAHGGFLLEAQQAGWQAEGVEPSAEAAGIARQRGFSVHEGFLDDLPTEEREIYDWVAFWMVFEHVPNPREFLQQVHDLLRPSGVITLSVPNAATWERWLFGRHWLGYDAPRHLQVFTESKLRELLESEGFRHVRVIHQSNTRYWTGSFAGWGMHYFPKAQWPKTWMDYFRNEPPIWCKWLLLIPGKINALLELSGRITVEARKF